MFARGPASGTSFKNQALAILPNGSHCRRVTSMGISGFVVYLPDGTGIASAGSSGQAWREALDWASRQPRPKRA